MRIKDFVLTLGHSASVALAAATPRSAASAFTLTPRKSTLDWNVPRSDDAFTAPRPGTYSVEFFNDPGTHRRRRGDPAAPRAAETAPYWQNLGGSVASHPSAVSWGSSRLDIFHMTSDRWCQHRSYDTVQWSAWESLGGSLDGAVATCSRGSGYISVGVKGTDGQCWHRPYSASGGGWASWETLGGNISFDPGFVSRSGSSMDAFVSAPDGQCWHKAWSASSWAKWEALGGYLDSSPKVVSWGSDHMSIYCKGQDGQAWWKKWNGFTWDDWFALGGSVVGTPTAVVWTGFEAVFVLGSDGACWHRRWQSGSWTQWVSLGGSLKHEPEAIFYQYSSYTSIEVYINHQDGGTYRKSWDTRTDTWSQEWEPLGGHTDSKPGAISWDNGRRGDSFGQGTDHSCQRLVLNDGTNDGSFGRV